MRRIDVFTDDDGVHQRMLVDGLPSPARIFISRSLDPAHPAIWLDGKRKHDVEFYWNGTFQFMVGKDWPEVQGPHDLGHAATS
jgi:hypothetical protein